MRKIQLFLLISAIPPWAFVRKTMPFTYSIYPHAGALKDGDTLRHAAILLDVGVDTETLFARLYLEAFEYLKFKAHIYEKMQITENGVAYIIVDREMQQQFGLSMEQASAVIGNLDSIRGCICWLAFIETGDEKNSIRVRLRSRFVHINSIAEKGTDGNDVIKTKDGHDTIDVSMGNDTVYAGKGEDTIVFEDVEYINSIDQVKTSKGKGTKDAVISYGDKGFSLFFVFGNVCNK